MIRDNLIVSSCIMQASTLKEKRKQGRCHVQIQLSKCESGQMTPAIQCKLFGKDLDLRYLVNKASHLKRF